MTSVPAANGRTAFKLMRDRTFGPFVLGKIASSSGNWIQQIAAAVLMFELTRSAFMVGIVSAALFAGPMLLALWSGALSDRHNRGWLLIMGRALSGGAVGVLAVLILVRGVDEFGGVPVLLVSAGLMGVGHALSVPAMQAITPGLVPEEDLEQALAFASVAPSIARTVGPALGAGLILLGGVGLAFASAAAAHLLFLCIVFAIRTHVPQRASGRADVLGGLRYLVTNRAAGLLIIAIAMLGFGVDPVITLAPSLADQLGGGSQLVGLFASVFGVGAVVVVAFFRQLRRMLSLRWVGVTGFLVVAAGLLVAALVPTAMGAAVGFFINGVGFMLAMIALNTRIQRRVPEDLRGRVMALWGLAFLGSRPIAAPINGAVADLLSVSAAMMITALIVLAAALPARAQYRDTTPR